MNKIISKLPNIINYSNKVTKCNSNIGNIIKLKLIESIYLELKPEDIIQTFIYIYNHSGKGIYFNIKKNKIKQSIIFNNINLEKITKSELAFAKQIVKLFTYILKNNSISDVMFFVNLNPCPIINNNITTKMIPVISFTSSFNHNDIVLPLPKIIKYNEKITKGILFIFNKKDTNSSIYKKIIEINNHPFYKTKNINYIVIDNINKLNKIDLYSTIVIIDPIYFQYLLHTNTTIILIEDKLYSYYSILLIPNKEFILWNNINWEEQLDNYIEDKNIKNNLKIWVDRNLVKCNIINKYIGFLEHLQQNFTNYNNTAITTINKNQLEYNNFFNLLESNYKQLRCWGYRYNPLFRLLTIFKTNHNFIPEFIRIALRSFPKYNTIHWICNRRVLLDETQIILKKNIFSYIVKDSNELNMLNIINNIMSVFYIELEHSCSNFRKWENEFVSDFETILEFIHKQPIGSTFIIRTYTFMEPQTVSLIERFSSNFESVKIIKNKLFDSFMPYRYLVGINYTKNNNIKPVDIEKYNNEYFMIETNSLIDTLKYIKLPTYDLSLFTNNNMIDSWISKNIY
jgi:hypothetical protein